jgi:hypothetical protein
LRLGFSPRGVASTGLADGKRLRHVIAMADQTPPKPPKRPLTPPAQRALAEAAARRAAHDRHRPDRPQEIGGPAGPEPTRYGDWDIKGLTPDF